MSFFKKTDPLESFKNSLRFSLREQIAGLRESKVRLGTWALVAPLEELPPGVRASKILDLLFDYEFDPPHWTRLWFDMEYLGINRIDMTAVYKARAEY